MALTIRASQRQSHMLRPLWVVALQTLWLTLLLTFILCGNAQAQTDAATAEKLLRKSGLWEQLKDIPAQMRTGMGTAAGPGATALSAAELQRLERAVDLAYAAPRLRATAQRVVQAELKAAHVKPLLAWFDSVTGLAMTQWEEASGSTGDDPSARVQEGASRLGSMAPARRELLAALNKESRAAPAMANMSINTALGVQQGLLSAQPDRPGPTLAQMRAELEAQRAAMEEAFGGLMLALAAVTYEAASDAQLAAYLAFLQSPAGAHFTEVAEHALDQLFLEAGTELGRAMPGTREGANV